MEEEKLYTAGEMAKIELDWKKYDILLDYFNSKKVKGYLHVPKEYGMFVAGND